jgi:hypothetical protein
LDANFACKESENPLFATRGFRERDVELRAIRESGAIGHENTIAIQTRKFAFAASKIWFGLALPGHVLMAS